jgi:dolichyl-phosphate beta-glucosyltransferase
MLEARGRYRLFMDADLATPLRHLDDVKALMDTGGKVGIAVRNLSKIHKGFIRKIISTATNIMVQLLLLPGVKDTQCGFKVFEEGAAKAVFGRMTLLLWSFDIEILAIANQLKYQIEYFPADDWHDPKEAGEGLVGDSATKVALKSFFDPFKIRWNIWTNGYRNVNYEHDRRV